MQFLIYVLSVGFYDHVDFLQPFSHFLSDQRPESLILFLCLIFKFRGLIQLQLLRLMPEIVPQV